MFFNLFIKQIYRFTAVIFEAVFLRVKNLIVPLINLYILQSVLWWGYDSTMEVRYYHIQEKTNEIFEKYGWGLKNPPDIDILNSYLSQVERDFDRPLILFAVLLVFGLGFEVFGRTVNRRIRKKINSENTSGAWAAKDTYEYVITLFDRFFAVGLYLYPTVDTYLRSAASISNLYPGTFVYVNIIVAPICEWYIKNVIGSLWGWGQALLFFIMYYGVARNRDNMKYFTRYHGMQAILVHGVFIFVNQLGSTFFYRNPNSFYGDKYQCEMVLYLALLVTPMVTSAIIGLETRIYFWDEAIQYHIGPRPPRKKRGQGSE